MMVLCQPCHAGYKDDIGFTLLQSELGGSMPTGSGIMATQTEARTSYGTPLGPYLPDTSDSQFSGKTIIKKTPDSVTSSSGHATGVGRLFYGNTSSLSPGITNIDCYEANDWLQSGFLMNSVTYLGKPIQPFYTWPSVMSSTSCVANHSWVGAGAIADDVLRRLDFVVETDEFIQVVAPANGTTNQPLLISAFNTISAGRSDGSHQRGSVFVDSVYTADRTKPDLVVPQSYTSSAAPLASSVTALLVETGQDPARSTDPAVSYTNNRSGARIYNAERSEVLKAALMAGADRVTHNGSFTNITDYRVASSNQSANGLDKRFGAGQVNVYHSYHIIAAGEQNSAEDYPAGQGNIGWYGFDYDPFFGGNQGSNAAASYYFATGPDPVMLFVSLVWNIDINGGTWDNFNHTATLYNLDLFLHEVTIPSNTCLVASSAGTGDNTENLWVPLSPGRTYRLQVRSGQGPIMWDYALAWRVATPADSDSDGMSDDWEVYFGLNHLYPGDAGADSDGDGLINRDEFLWNTDPSNLDSDGDGFSDGQEVTSGSNPMDSGSIPSAAVPGMTGAVFLLTVCGLLWLTRKQWRKVSD
jgi:hypothetical protein